MSVLFIVICVCRARLEIWRCEDFLEHNCSDTDEYFLSFYYLDLQMESMEESVVPDLQPGISLNFGGNVSPLGLGPDYDLQQSNLALLKAELKVLIILNGDRACL